MFKPNQKCRIQLAGGTDVYGEPVPVQYVTERCSVVRLMNNTEKSSVRADSSASRGNAEEVQADCVLLMTTATRVRLGDVVELHGARFKVSGRWPRFDVNGRLDHVEIHAMMWELQ